jgi:tetratricopeptide (TPR) repeat protein
MYKSFTFHETSNFEKPKYENFKNIGSIIEAKIKLQIIKNGIEYDRNITRLEDIKDFHFVIDEYRQFPKMFPQSKEIPATYLYIAHIFWSELNDFNSAFNEYELLLKKYPNYKLDSSIKTEMELVRKQVREKK